MNSIPPCPSCKSPYGYELNDKLICPECGFEWTASIEVETNANSAMVVKDANGNILVDGDSVVLIKNLPVKGSTQTLKIGTKVKNIKLVDGDHNIDCKIDGLGSMALKSIYVKKA